MLELKNIKKSYTTGDFTQVALNEVSITFRDNEFAAILGPSGSGKTTMLNIVGGLDKYDSGDLEIENISTKKYQDQDWDTYRNNRIGFVFQSYNLIPHQTILANVELALTLSGVSSGERKEKAKDALDKVGLVEHIHKLPSQLSGGQMQRVAIARALINDPEILLADEPTGALDSTTSTQVLELLTEIAEDRLVIMVTHNSELAEEYANRIVQLKDGEIVSDTRPFDATAEEPKPGKEVRKASMSFVTALSLSFSNLMTKKWRTLVTALAGSIGIIGIAAILALANGINAYIRTVEEETLSLYPLMIQSTGFDLGEMFEGMGGGPPAEDVEEGLIQERQVLSNMFALVSNNDLESLKVYFESNRETLDPLVNSIHYMYDLTPRIFLADTSDGAVQVNPDPLLTPLGMGGGDMGMGFGGFRMNVFHEMPAEIEMFENQYDLVAGHWPESFDEVILVLSHRGRISDMELYAMGLRDRDSLEEMVESLMDNVVPDVDTDEERMLFSPETLMGVEFRVVNPFQMFEYDDDFNVWVDRSGDQEFMTELVENGLSLRISGIVRPSESATATALSNGINYTPALISHLIEVAAEAEIVQNQKMNKYVNVFTGRTFEEEREDVEAEFDFSRIISVDEDLLAEIFEFDISGMDFDLNFSGMNMNIPGFDMDFSNINIDPSALGNLDINLDGLEAPAIDISGLTSALAGQLNIPTEEIMGVIVNVMQDFFLEILQSGITDPEEIMVAMEEYLARPDVQANIVGQLNEIVANAGLEGQVTELLQGFIEEVAFAYVTQLMGALQTQVQAQMEQAMNSIMAEIGRELGVQMGGLMGQFEGAFAQLGAVVAAQIEEAFEQVAEEMAEQMQGIDPEAMADAFQIEMTEEELFQLMASLMQPAENTYERNLSLLGYADKNVPAQINIYPRNFDAKHEVMDILDNYNQRMEESGQEDKVIRYTDLVGAMMSSVTDIINMVSYALIAFVAISLVVSSIMIGVITYISVLERKKEIGILRAIGASKGNIRQVFNAETLIVGFVAGVLGVLITLVISAIANVIVFNRFDIDRIARLPLTAAIILVGASMFLTYIAGLLPSSAAARKDPIEALRSE